MQTWVYSNTVELTTKSSCPAQLVCSPANQTVNINQAASLSATGGNGSYVWSAPGASAQTVSGQTISVTYNNSGSKSVQVTSGSQTATCNVQVNIPLPTTTTLTISKVVRNVTQGGSFAENLSNVRVGDVLEYQLRVRNTGSVAASAVTLRDYLNQPNLLSDFRNMTTSQLFTGSFGNGSVVTFASDLQPNAEFVVGYLFTVSAQMNGTISACNTATTTANNAASATDTACVTGTPGVPNLVLSKSAYNDTKNVDATTRAASREDYITYTLTVRNTGNSDATNYVFTDNLSGVLPLADMVDLGGGTLVAQTLSYPAVTVPAGGTVSKTFRVRVKYFLSSSISYQMINTFGNTVVIVINPPTPYTPPKTGGMTDVLGGIGFAGLLTSAALLQRKKNILKLIFA
jgi:uncharacterized repeat protein (TIGR01451 family)